MTGSTINALATMMLGVTVVLIVVTGIVLRCGASTSGTEARESAARSASASCRST